MRTPLVPKGRAMGLQMTDEWTAGFRAGSLKYKYENPFDFFDEYEKHYAFCIGFQAGEK